MSSGIDRIWYGRSCLAQCLRPLSWMYRAIFAARRWFMIQFFRQKHDIPIIVVGNLTVGGTGKTPLLIAIVKFLQQQGLRVGVVSRGYRSRAKQYPFWVKEDTPVELAGDEPLLIAKNTSAPVVISPKRNAAINALIEECPIDVIVSDDGLQHDAMKSALDIVVVDGIRGLGNGYCLPAGPLREPASRLKHCDFIVVNGGGDRSLDHCLMQQREYHRMTVQPLHLIQLQTEQCLDLVRFQQRYKKPVAAVAGIGHPARFFDTLMTLGILFEPHIFPDHHRFIQQDLSGFQNGVIMTEKDAIKCQAFAEINWYYLSIAAQLPDSFWSALLMHPCLQALI